jgi:hypothetical protein
VISTSTDQNPGTWDELHVSSDPFPFPPTSQQAKAAKPGKSERPYSLNPISQQAKAAKPGKRERPCSLNPRRLGYDKNPAARNPGSWCILLLKET